MRAIFLCLLIFFPVLSPAQNPSTHKLYPRSIANLKRGDLKLSPDLPPIEYFYYISGGCRGGSYLSKIKLSPYKGRYCAEFSLLLSFRTYRMVQPVGNPVSYVLNMPVWTFGSIVIPTDWQDTINKLISEFRPVERDAFDDYSGGGLQLVRVGDQLYSLPEYSDFQELFSDTMGMLEPDDYPLEARHSYYVNDPRYFGSPESFGRNIYSVKLIRLVFTKHYNSITVYSFYSDSEETQLTMETSSITMLPNEWAYNTFQDWHAIIDSLDFEVEEDDVDAGEIVSAMMNSYTRTVPLHQIGSLKFDNAEQWLILYGGGMACWNWNLDQDVLEDLFNYTRKGNFKRIYPQESEKYSFPKRITGTITPSF